jgi:hypothetical protein
MVVHLLGYGDRRELRSDVARLAGLLDASRLMSRRDCRQLLLAELAFASGTLGWSRDWSSDTAFTERDTITVLRGVQERLAGIVHGAAKQSASATPRRQVCGRGLPLRIVECEARVSEPSRGDSPALQ